MLADHTIPPVRMARGLNVVGRIMITAGVLILLFVAYQLWGTGIREAQAQDRLKGEFANSLAAGEGSTTTSTTAPPDGTTDPAASQDTSDTITLPPVTAPPTLTQPNEGDAVAQIQIPKIGLDAIVVEGVGVDDLKNGPGHYVETPMPGQKGNAAIAGHRTTYGAPFGRIDELDPGDEIHVKTQQGSFTYKVMPNGTSIVGPNAVEVLQDKGDNRLTLTACHPKYSASKRIVVAAELEGEALPVPVTQHPKAPQSITQLTVSGAPAPKLPAILYGLLCAAIWIGAYLLGRVWRKWPAYFIGFPFFMIALFYFFESFSRLLPANY
jgi:sortase A